LGGVSLTLYTLFPNSPAASDAAMTLDLVIIDRIVAVVVNY